MGKHVVVLPIWIILYDDFLLHGPIWYINIVLDKPSRTIQKLNICNCQVPERTDHTQIATMEVTDKLLERLSVY